MRAAILTTDQESDNHLLWRLDLCAQCKSWPAIRSEPKSLFGRVEHGSFSSLARAWKVKPSSISRQVSQLEEELGVRLLARTTRQLHLTEAGTLLYERAKAALDDLDDAFRSAAEFSSAPRGRLRLSAPVAFGRRFIAPIIKPFLDRYEHLQLEVAFLDRFVDLVGEGYDAAVRAGHVRDEGVVARRLAPNNRVLVASPDYLQRRSVPAEPNDLVQHDALVFQYVDATNELRFRRAGQISRVTVNAKVSSNNGDLLVQTAVDGVGVGLLPYWLAADALTSGALVSVLSDYEVTATDFDADLHLIYPSRRFVPAKVRVLLAFLEEHLNPPPWLRK